MDVPALHRSCLCRWPLPDRIVLVGQHLEVGLDHRLVQLLADPASSGLPALILSGQDGLTTHLAADVGEGMIEAWKLIAIL